MHFELRVRHSEYIRKHTYLLIYLPIWELLFTKCISIQVLSRLQWTLREMHVPI